MPFSDDVRAAARDTVFEMVGRKVADGDSLIASGLIDSLSILKLISRLEKKLGVKLPPQNLQPDDFETVDWITETVCRTAQK